MDYAISRGESIIISMTSQVIQLSQVVVENKYVEIVDQKKKKEFITVLITLIYFFVSFVEC